MDEFLGTIKIFGFNFAPRGWMTCQGQTLAISSNSALFALLGTTYGGNGQTTFGLPNLQGRAPIGIGTGPGLPAYQIGQVGGVNAVTLLQTQLPQHTHAATAASTSTSTSTMYAESAAPSGQNPNGKMLATGQFYTDPVAANNRAMGPDSVATTTTTTTTVTVQPAGGSQPVDITNPYMAVNYCICTEGVFPSRN